MKILAIEQSTPSGSVALLEDEKILAEKTWHDSRNQAPSLFHFVPELCRTAGVGLEEISLYTAGLGPGGYTGLRTSLVAARSYALPGRTECYGVSSGHAVAYQIFKKYSIESATVVGDARRNRVWTGSFNIVQGLPEQDGEWQLASAEDLKDYINKSSTVVSSEPARLELVLKTLETAGFNIFSRAIIPSAGDVGVLSGLMLRAGVPSLPLRPIYAHPPVAESSGESAS